jgi:O-antigen ligase
MNERKIFRCLAAALGIGIACSISLANVAWVTAGVLWILLFVRLRLRLRRDIRQGPGGDIAPKPGEGGWKKTGLEWPMGIFALWSLVTSNWPAGAGEIFHNYKSETLLLLFFVMTQAFENADNRTFLRAFLAASLVNALWGCLQKSLGMSWDPTTHERILPPALSFLSGLPPRVFRAISLRDGRAVGFRSHPLTYAECLLPAFFIFLGTTLERNSIRSHWRRLAAAGWVALAIFFSESRGVWLGLATGLGLLALLHRRRRTWGVTSAIAALAALALWISPLARVRFVSMYKPVSGQNELSKDVRFELWAASWKALKAHPLAGVGTGNLRIFRVEGETGGQGPKIWTESHNIYLQQAAEKGVIGLALFLWLLFDLGKVFQGSCPPWRDGLLAGFAGLLICGLTESWFNDSTVLMTVFALSGSVWHLGMNE